MAPKRLWASSAETLMKILETLAKFCSVLSGILLTFITLMTCYSLIGRNTTGDTIVGDFELTGVATGAAIALFMPLCQLKKSQHHCGLLHRQSQ